MALAARSDEIWEKAPIWERWWRFSAYVVKRFQGDDGLQIASALTYTSLLSLVPLLAVSLVILSGFGAFDDMREQVQDLLLGLFVPTTATQVANYITLFLANAQKVTVFGVLGLGATAIVTLATIESTFNRIWRAGGQRPWPLRILAFWAVLTLGPIVLGISLTVSAEVQNLTSEIVIGGGLARGGRLLLQFGVQWTAFTALYLAIPAAPVKLMHAVMGGFAAMLLFSILKGGFGLFVAMSENYRTIYGALAAIPIFLLWLYAFWTLLLIGAHIAAALPERRQLGRDGLIDETTAENRLRAALLLLRRIWQAAGSREILEPENLKPPPAPAVLADLERAGLVVRLEDGRLIAGCDYGRAPIGVLWRALDLATPQLEDADAPPVLADLMEAERAFMGHRLADLLSVYDPKQSAERKGRRSRR